LSLNLIMAWFFWALFIIFLLYVSNIIILLILENRDPYRTISWILVLLCLPGVGIILYYFAGENFKSKFYDWRLKRPKYAKIMRKIVETQKQFLSSDSIPSYLKDKKNTLYLALQATQFPFSKKNKVKILNNAEIFYPELFLEIKKAKDHIHLEFFEILPDSIGKEFVDLLLEKSNQGVKVRLICDGHGSSKFIRKYKKIFLNNQIDFAIFNPRKFSFFKNKLNHVNHRKLTVIDGRIGFLGGTNIGDKYLHKSKFGYWRDLQLKVEGTSVYSLQTVFIRDWFYATRKDIYNYYLYPKIKSFGETNLHIAPSGPDFKIQNSKMLLFSLITNSEKRLYLQTPYFVPDNALIMALKNAALKGVDVKIILPEKSDVGIYNYINKTFLPELLDVGIKIYFYKKGFIHTKLMVSDDVVSVGSANFNTRAMDLDFELNAYLFDQKLANAFVKIYEDDLLECVEVNNKDLRAKNVWQRFAESLTRLLTPFL